MKNFSTWVLLAVLACPVSLYGQNSSESVQLGPGLRVRLKVKDVQEHVVNNARTVSKYFDKDTLTMVVENLGTFPSDAAGKPKSKSTAVEKAPKEGSIVRDTAMCFHEELADMAVDLKVQWVKGRMVVKNAGEKASSPKGKMRVRNTMELSGSATYKGKGNAVCRQGTTNFNFSEYGKSSSCLYRWEYFVDVYNNSKVHKYKITVYGEVEDHKASL
jgi:hypothetical protein